MRKTFIVIFIILFSNQAFSQVFYASKGYLVYTSFYAEIKKDSSYLEVFFLEPPDFINKGINDTLISDGINGRISYTGKQTQIVKIGNTYYLTYPKNWRNGKKKNIELKILKNDRRDSIRNEAYACDKRVMLMKMADSLLGSDYLIRYDINKAIRAITKEHIMDSNFVELVDEAADSIVNKIMTEKDPFVDHYYKMADSIEQLDTAVIYQLLSKENLKFKYCQYFIYQLSIKKPENLISYLDKNPSNKEVILSSIRNSPNLKEITKNVRKTSIKSKGEKEILKQRRKKIASDIAIGSAYGAIVLSEIGLVILAIIWIF